MGRHADGTSTRGVARWVISVSVAVLALAVIITGTIIFIGDVEPENDGRCTAAVSLPVAAGPLAARALAQAAQDYNATAPVVRSACVIATVTAVRDGDVIDGLLERWRTKNGPPPGLWIADSAASLATLDSIDPSFTAGHTTDPFAWSPVVLAAAPDTTSGIGTLSWHSLLTNIAPNGDIKLPHDQRIRLLLPPIASNPASSFAVQSMLVDQVTEGSVTDDLINTHKDSLRAMGRATSSAPATTAAALKKLAATASQAETASIARLVPVVEADLARFDDDLVALYPEGDVVGHALIPAPISAEWTNRTVIAAANDFVSYLMSSPGQQTLADHHWRTISAEPTDDVDCIDITTPITMRPAGDNSINTAIAVALGQQEAAPEPTPTTITTPTAPPPVTSETPPSTTPTTPTSEPEPEPDPEPQYNDQGPILTLVVDTSSGMDTTVDGKTLLEWVVDSLPDIVSGELTDSAGLWIYSDAEFFPPAGFSELVTTGLLTDNVTIGDDDDPIETTRARAFERSTDLLEPVGERWAYGALIEVLKVAKTTTIDGRESHVILITSGADDTPGTPRQMVLDALQSAASTVTVDVIGLGDAVPADAYSHIAKDGGGEYYPITDPSTMASSLVNIFADND